MKLWTAYQENKETSTTTGSAHIQFGLLKMANSDVSVSVSDSGACAASERSDVNDH